MSELVVIEKPSDEVVVINDEKFVAVKEKQIDVITIGIQGPAGPAGSSAADATFTALAGEDIEAHRVVCSAWQIDFQTFETYHTAIKLKNTAGNELYARGVLGISVNSALNGEQVTIKPFGVIEDFIFDFVGGNYIYCDQTGQLKVSVSNPVFHLVIGKAISRTKLFINIQEPIIF